MTLKIQHQCVDHHQPCSICHLHRGLRLRSTCWPPYQETLHQKVTRGDILFSPFSILCLSVAPAQAFHVAPSCLLHASLMQSVFFFRELPQQVIVCHICGKVMKSESTLKNHIEHIHNSEGN